jgi:hypothetical protein
MMLHPFGAACAPETSQRSCCATSKPRRAHRSAEPTLWWTRHARGCQSSCRRTWWPPPVPCTSGAACRLAQRVSCRCVIVVRGALFLDLSWLLVKLLAWQSSCLLAPAVLHRVCSQWLPTASSCHTADMEAPLLPPAARASQQDLAHAAQTPRPGRCPLLSCRHLRTRACTHEPSSAA